MTHTYHISGMTCSGCVAKVQSLLSSVTGVKNVTVDLATQSATIHTEKDLSIPQLQSALTGTKYTVAAQDLYLQPAIKTEAVADAPITFKTYVPLILIFAYIIGVTLLIEALHGTFNAISWMNHFMAGFFLVFSFFKLLDIPGFAMSYSSYDIIARRWTGYGYIYPFIELALGISFLIPALHFYSNIATLVVMGVSIIGVLQAVLSRQKIKCACLGAVFNLPMSTVTIVEDALMIAMSLTCLIMMKA